MGIYGVFLVFYVKYYDLEMPSIWVYIDMNSVQILTNAPRISLNGKTVHLSQYTQHIS